MAEVLLGATSLSGSAGVVAKYKRLVRSGGSLAGSASLTAKPMRISLAKSGMVVSASVGARAVRMQKSKSTMAAGASMVGKGRIIKYPRPVPISAGATVQAETYRYKTINLQISAGATVETYHYDRDIKAAVADYLPAYYRDFKQVDAMLGTTANESTRLHAKLYELLDQFFVNSATYGLERWEELSEIEIIPQRSTDSQRHFVNAKLRGVGTVTPALMKSIVDAFYETELYEEIADFKLRFKIVGKRGVPKNLEDMEEAIMAVIPAHLAHHFEFTFQPWYEADMIRRDWIEAGEYTHESLATLPWQDFEGVGIRWAKVSEFTADGIEKAYNINKEDTE